jgi:hypothetical protein
MDERRFDRFARRLAATGSRRSAFRLVAGGLLGAAFGGGMAAPGAGKRARQCREMTCQPGWACCKFRHGGGCYLRKYLRCCQQQLCAKGDACCGSGCCQKGWQCCGHGICCPKGWRCGNGACEATFARAAAATMPFAPAQPADTGDWVERGWLTLAFGRPSTSAGR